MPTNNWHAESMPAGNRHADSMPAGTWHGESMPAGTWHAESMPASNWHAESIPAGTWHAESMPAGNWPMCTGWNLVSGIWYLLVTSTRGLRSALSMHGAGRVFRGFLVSAGTDDVVNTVKRMRAGLTQRMFIQRSPTCIPDRVALAIVMRQVADVEQGTSLTGGYARKTTADQHQNTIELKTSLTNMFEIGQHF